MSADPPSAPPRPRMGVGLAAAAALVAGLVFWVVFLPGWPREFWRPASPPAEVAPTPRPAFVGAQACVGCHADQYSAWRGSHHALAMLEASEESVLGDFDHARFAYAGTTSTFFRRDGTFKVRTDGPDGQLAEFEVRYTFGVEPLQQYLIELPGGRLQALSIAWDTRPRQHGGQRWFHLYPDERITHTDERHWTGRQQNWNFMCADCHSTNLRKNYDAASDRYRTTWSDINVACEACHGPGADHIAWAESGPSGAARAGTDNGLTVNFRPRLPFSLDPATGRPVLTGPHPGATEMTVCAQCHSRRGQFSDEYIAGEPLLDHYLAELVLPSLYHADGQQKDEVFTYGSFLQSRMYRAGVTCTHCHEPHSGQLRAPGNQVCGQCHVPARYDAADHHFHASDTDAAECVSCHMPSTTYMVVDPRRDHSFPVPRPDLTVTLGVPNPCTGCHADQPADWAADRLVEWYGRVRAESQRFAEAFHADEQNQPGAAAPLARIAEDSSHPAIVRASALERLSRRPGHAVVTATRKGLADPDPLVRRAALSVVETMPGGDRARLAAPLLRDPSRAVRLQAAWVLATERRRLLLPDLQLAFDRAADEFIASQRHLADRAENRTTLGTFFVHLGRLTEAEAEYRAAMRLLPGYAPAYVNLADLYRTLEREAEVELTLRQGLEAAPGQPLLHHALGLALVRAGRVDEALIELHRAATRAPDDARIVYTYAVALHSTGQVGQAIRALAIGHEFRLSSLWGKVKELVDAGFVGTPQYVLVELSRNPYRHGADSWRYDIDRVGNWILEEPIHFFDLARWYLSSAGDPVKVYATANSRQPDHPELQDNFSAIVHFPDAAYAVVSQTLSAFEHHQTVKLTGTTGALWASWSGAMDRTRQPTFSLKAFDGETVHEIPIEKITGEVFELEDQIDLLVRAVRDGAPLSATGEDGRWSVAMCLAAAESVEAGRPMSLEQNGFTIAAAPGPPPNL